MKITPSERDVLHALYFSPKRRGRDLLPVAALSLDYAGKVLGGIRLSLKGKGLLVSEKNRVALTDAGVNAVVGR